MPLSIGDEKADSGMTKAIYTEMDRILRPSIEKAIDEGFKKMEEDSKDAATEATEEKEKAKQEAVEKAQMGWKQLSFAIAGGVLTHLQRDPANDEEYAEVFSSKSEDEVFWQWLQDFAEVFSKWADSENTQNDITALREALRKFFFDETKTPPVKKPIPASLKGVIR